MKQLNLEGMKTYRTNFESILLKIQNSIESFYRSGEVRCDNPLKLVTH